MMVSLHGQLTLSKNNGEESVHEGFSRLGQPAGRSLGDHLENVNQYWKTCLLWATLVPGQGNLNVWNT